MSAHRGAIDRILFCFIAGLVLPAMALAAAQSGNAGAIFGTVADPTGAVIPGATVHLNSAVSGLDRTAITDATGQFSIPNIPFHTYQITATAPGFNQLNQTVDVRSTSGTELKLVLQVSVAASTVTVEAGTGDLVENDPTFHTDVDRDLFVKVPLESTSALSSLVTATTPGVSGDSNGMVHGLGDHAENSFSVDGQSITDQQSKVFSNQIPSNSIQSLEVIAGAPPAEYGGKTSLVIVATTRSGQGVTTPTGSITGSYGSFGSSSGSVDLSYGGKKWGNFVEVDGLNTGRFLDPPEFSVFHDKGNELNAFDRVDFTLSSADSMHLDFNYSRSWFQNPNTYDNLNVQNVVAAGTSAAPLIASVGNTDQRSQISTFNISPTYTHVLNNESVFNLTSYVRRDDYHYYPSGNPLADRGPENLQTSSIAQYRTLTNAGGQGNISYVHKIHTMKLGAEYDSTFLRENDSLGVVDPVYFLTAPCVNATGAPVAGYSDPAQCSGALAPNPGYLSILAPYDFTRGGSYYRYRGQADIKLLGLFVQDQIKVGNWTANLGIRGDLYNGLTIARQAEPRLGLGYSVKRTGTVLGLSYARSLETPFNENLVLSSTGCGNSVLAPLLNCTPGVSTAEVPGYRNEFHANIQQGVGKHLVVSGEYIWKYTHNAFDFSVLGNTPITFPIDWHNSKIPGLALHLDVPEYHGFSAYSVMSSVAARFFPPQVAGAGATIGQTGLPFRIDHDEAFNQTTHLQYTWKHGRLLNGVWGGLNWRYDSGQVAGSAPCWNPLSHDPNSACDTTSTTLNGQPAVDLSRLTADEQFQAGLICNGVRATPGHPLPSACLASQFGSSLIRISAPGSGDNDHNPSRIDPRNLFDMNLGKNNIFHTDHYKTDLDLTAVNVTNDYALYNFLSTFSGTHYVTPRSVTAKVTLNF
ncbi:TonB-dependent receptor [Acidobacteria bacterium AB60]|nr:TonB-dependent receptor [Acidobacteria bacterium AB60]